MPKVSAGKFCTTVWPMHCSAAQCRASGIRTILLRQRKGIDLTYLSAPERLLLQPRHGSLLQALERPGGPDGVLLRRPGQGPCWQGHLRACAQLSS